MSVAASLAQPPLRYFSKGAATPGYVAAGMGGADSSQGGGLRTMRKQTKNSTHLN